MLKDTPPIPGTAVVARSTTATVEATGLLVEFQRRGVACESDDPDLARDVRGDVRGMYAGCG